MAVLNQSGRERSIRVVAGIVLALLAWVIWGAAGAVLSASGILSLVVLLVGLAAVVTGVIGWCPLYTLLGISTNGDVRAWRAWGSVSARGAA
jgi:threonine/homoserine/homoserine lactone efflux protein